MKKLVMLVLSFIFSFCFISNVCATEVVVDPNNDIEMPYKLLVDDTNYISFKNDIGATKYYQIVDVSNNTEIVNYIDENIVGKLNNLAEKEIEFSKYESGTNESINLNNDIQFVKESIDEAVKSEKLKTLINDYDESAWLSLTENIIPTDNIVKNKYYIVWVKVQNNSAVTYEYFAYKALDNDYYKSVTAEEVENPDTGIEHTILFITVGALILVGTGLVINKNKESY